MDVPAGASPPRVVIAITTMPALRLPPGHNPAA
jgi:hypothetical protein